MECRAAEHTLRCLQAAIYDSRFPGTKLTKAQRDDILNAMARTRSDGRFFALLKDLGQVARNENLNFDMIRAYLFTPIKKQPPAKRNPRKKSSKNDNTGLQQKF